MSVKKNTLKDLRRQLREEVDPGKREQLKLLLDEMGEVYPDQSEIPEDPDTMFIQPKQWKKEEKKKVVIAMKARSGDGKTYFGLSSSHATTKHIKNDFKGLKQEELNDFISYLKNNYIPFTPVYAIGLEESFLECLRSDDNKEYFEHADIRYIEVLERDAGGGTSLINHMKTYKNLLTALYSMRNQKRGTVILDPMSAVLTAEHNVMRRVIMKIPSLKKDQGILPRHWFWRNAEQEGIMAYLRMLQMNVVFTVKVIDQTIEGNKDIEKVRWHEETNKHLASVVLYNRSNKNNYRTTVEKCRPNSALKGKMFNNLTIPKFLYQLYRLNKNPNEQ